MRLTRQATAVLAAAALAAVAHAARVRAAPLEATAPLAALAARTALAPPGPAAAESAETQGQLLVTYSQAIGYAGSKVGYRTVAIWRLGDGGHRLQTSEFLKGASRDAEALHYRVLKAEVGPGGRPRHLDCEVVSPDRSWRVKGRAEGDEFVLERALRGSAPPGRAPQIARIPLEDDVTFRSWALWETFFGGGLAGAGGRGQARRWRVIDEALGGLAPDPCFVQVVGPRAFHDRPGSVIRGTLIAFSDGPEAVAHLLDGTGRVLRSVWQSGPRTEEMVPPAEARRLGAFESGPAAPAVEGLSGDRYRSARLGYQLYVPPYPFVVNASPAEGTVRLSDLTDAASVTVRPALDPEMAAHHGLGDADVGRLVELVQRQWAAGYDEVHALPPCSTRFAAREAHMVEGRARQGCTTFHFRNLVVGGDGVILLVTILAADRTLAERRDLVDPVASSLRLTVPEGGLALEVSGPVVRVPFYGIEVRRPSGRWIVPARLGGPATVLALARDDGAAACVVRVLVAVRSRPGADPLAEVVADQAQRVGDNLGIEKPRPAKAVLAGRPARELVYEGDLLPSGRAAPAVPGGGRPARARALYLQVGERIFTAVAVYRKDAEGAQEEAEGILAGLRLDGPPGRAPPPGAGAGPRRPAVLAAPPEAPGGPAEGQPSVGSLLVLPVESDEEGLGRQIELMLRSKARRLGVVVYDPSSVAEALRSLGQGGPGRAPTVDTPPAELRRLAREAFQADAAVVGRARGVGRDYQVRLVAVYASGPHAGRAFDKTYSCGYHQIIPLEMAKAVREVLLLPPLAEGQAEDPQAERRWREAPNLVRNGHFEAPNAAGDGPAHWQPVEREMAWVACPDGPGKALRFRMSASTAATYGLDFYSDPFPIEPGATYRFSVRVKSLGPTTKVFLKGYHEFPPMEGYPAERRETYRRQVHPKGEKGRWETVVAEFVPGATRPEHRPTFLKVDLYAYHPAGEVYWDDVVLKKVRDAPAQKEMTKSEGRTVNDECRMTND